MEIPEIPEIPSWHRNEAIFSSQFHPWHPNRQRQWRDLFTLAGLNWGRDKGLTWHTGRHEFISRLAEKNGENLKVVQEGARHRRMETTEKYMHARRDAVVAAVAGLER